ncbi:MAG: hypothetical protein SVU32_09055, partial [Candidatus Nanohaloarchaea archaeon]|nr:hypothetical protein [Candidatus Nanohaloarchaea archaeon]
VAAKVHSITKNGFKGGICFQNSENDCANNVAETKVGWIAIEPSKIPFLTGFSADRFTDTVDGSTRYHSHAFGDFTSSPVMLAEQQTYNEGEDLVSAGIGSINTTGYNIMLCELTNLDSCGGHLSEQVATLALPSGTIYSNLADYKSFTNDEIRLRSTGINIQISGGTKIGSARFYHSNSTHGMQSSYFLDDGFEHDLGNNWTVQQYNNGGSASTSDGCGASKGTEALRIKN